MAMYFHGAPPPEIQPDGLQTLYLMNPGYVGYHTDASSAAANMVLFNSSANSLNPVSLYPTPQPSTQQQQQHFVGIPLQSPDSGRPPSIQYNLWTPTPASNPLDMMAQLGPRHPSQQGLSLSLSPQVPNYTPYRPAPAISPASGDEVRVSGPSPQASGVSNGMPGLQSVLTGSKYLKAAQQLLDEVANVGKGVKGESLPAPKAAKTQVREKKETEDGKGGGEVGSKLGTDLTTAERQELHMKKAKLVSMLDEVEQRYRQYNHQMQVVIAFFEAAAGFGSARTYTAVALQTISKQFRCLRDAISGQIRATGKSLGDEDPKANGVGGVGSRLRFVDHHLRQQRALQQLGMVQHNAWRPQRGLPERSVSVLRAWLFEHFLHPYPKDSDKQMLAKQAGLTRSQVSNWFINARVRLWKPMVEEMYLEETKEREQQLQQNNGDDNISKTNGVNEDSVTSKSSSTHQESSPTRTEQEDCLVAKRDNRNPPPPPAMILPSSASSGTIRMQPSYSDDDDAIVQEKLKKARGEDESFLHLNAMPSMYSSKPEEAEYREFFMKFGDIGRRGGVVDEDGGYSLINAGGGNHGGGFFGVYPIVGGGDMGGRFDPEQFAPPPPRFSSGNGGVSLTLGLQHCEGLPLSGAHPSYLSGESIPPLGRRLELSTETAADYCSHSNNPPSVAVHPSNAFASINVQDRKRFVPQLLLPDYVA